MGNTCIPGGGRMELHSDTSTPVMSVLAGRIVTFAVAVSVLLLAYVAEPAYFPVIRDWTVTKLDRNGRQVMLSGYMRKIRSCPLIGIVVTNEDGDRLPFSLVDGVESSASAGMPTGSQAWGPWSIVIEPSDGTSRLRFQATHQCHAGWPTTTELGEFNLFPGLQR